MNIIFFPFLFFSFVLTFFLKGYLPFFVTWWTCSIKSYFFVQFLLKLLLSLYMLSHSTRYIWYIFLLYVFIYTIFCLYNLCPHWQNLYAPINFVIFQKWLFHYQENNQYYPLYTLPQCLIRSLLQILQYLNLSGT